MRQCTSTAVVLERRQLALRAVGADPDLFDLLEQVCRERVAGAPAGYQDFRARAEAALLELLPYGAPSLERIARRLRTSRRTFGHCPQMTIELDLARHRPRLRLIGEGFHHHATRPATNTIAFDLGRFMLTECL